jgi:phospho-N-acetylmuramoyl-pentapeptide-transferase
MRVVLVLAVGTFGLMLPWGNLVIRTLLARGIRKHIRLDGPATHQVKAGTATMGGLYILAGVCLFTVALTLAGFPQGLLPLLAMLAFGALGAFDDLQGLRDQAGVGWLARYKFAWQWGVALLVALVFYLWGGTHTAVWPFSGNGLDLGLGVLPLTTLLLVWSANAVNLTDGLDGLAAGTALLSYLAYGVICLITAQVGLGLFCFVLVGALLAFLWYNMHPARMFMGDTGSQALGAGLAAVAILTGHWMLLPLIGIIFVAEAVSVMLQVGYFKYTKHKYGAGRRILRMAPLHHHFEKGGWSEVQITLRFWLVAAVAALLGVAGMGGQ